MTHGTDKTGRGEPWRSWSDVVRSEQATLDAQFRFRTGMDRQQFLNAAYRRFGFRNEHEYLTLCGDGVIPAVVGGRVYLVVAEAARGFRLPDPYTAWRLPLPDGVNEDGTVSMTDARRHDASDSERANAETECTPSESEDG